ncbi:MAG: sigma-70 family RNA polymerase sigma factor [Planctomycetes bacterium]|nr:sigma-70 family RNA polymerase sigma factor [Planctomycetota bacterium]
MTSDNPNSAAGSSPPGGDATSTSLLERVKAQDAEAWQRLVELYGPAVYLWCRQSGLQAEDAGDVIQEVFSSVAARIDTFRLQRPGDSFRGWLWTITRNKVRDHFRRLAGWVQAPGGTEAQELLAQVPDQPPDSSAVPPHATGEAGLERRAMELVRAGVEDRTWQAFWRVTVDGRPVADVADELGMTAAAVYKAKYRVLRRIREELGDLLE